MAALTFLSYKGVAQTYQVGPDAPGQPTTKQSEKQQDLGWGSNIQNARLARTAELALQRGDHAQAFSYAQRAAQAAPNDPQLWLLLGYAARLDGKLGASLDAYQHSLRLNPSSIDGMSGMAQTYLASGRTGEAERLLKQVVAAAPQRKNELLILGDLYIRTANYQEAKVWLEKAEHLEPAAQTELLLAIASQHLKQMDQAAHYLELAKGRAPNNPDVQRAFAAFYRDTGDYDKAVSSLAGIRNPKPDVVAELAFTYGLAGRPEESARTYAQAANAMPHDLTLQLSAAQAQVGIASFDRAEEFLRRASTLDANYYRLHAIRGQIAQIQDRDEDAAHEFSAAIAALPPTPIEGPLYGIQLHMDLIPLYKNLNQPDQARQELTSAQKLIGSLDERGADRAAFLRLRAVIHSEAGEYEAALSDMKESLALTPNDPNSLQLNGDVLVKLGRTSEAIAVFQQVLKLDPRNRFALTSLGYASRAKGDSAEAEKYFNLLAKDYPSSYVPYLALGDMYTDNREYKKAEEAYARGYKLAPQNSMIVAGGMDAAIESHNLPLAGIWQQRVSEKMAGVPQVLREEERYFNFMGDYRRSADLGRQALKLIPRDREVIVYLGYDLLHLQLFDELQTLTTNNMDVLPKDADVPLLAGYVYKHNGQSEEAVNAFTESLKRDPKVATAYTNRGFVYNDLRKPALAAADFEAALKITPDDAETHMGLAFAELNLGHPKLAIEQTQLAEAIAGDSKLIHVVRATAYGRQGALTKSTQEYRAALQFDPDDGSLNLGLANILMAQRRFREALGELQNAREHLPKDASLYAVMARANAELHNHDEAMRDVDLAEQYAVVPASSNKTNVDESDAQEALADVYVSTGEALSLLGEQDAAMNRFSKALELHPKNRVGVRLAVAKNMAKQGRTEDAERQIALAQMEVDAKDAEPPSGEQYIAMASVLQQLHEYELSQTYLERAKAAGAPDSSVRITLANSYLALGETRRAAAELAAVKQVEDSEVDYQYLLAQASLYQQEHRSAETLSSFAAAASDAGEDPTAEQHLLEAGGTEGYRVNPKVSLLSNLVVQPIFEDSTVYVLDSKLNSPAGPVNPSDVANLPPPRSSVETNLLNSFNLHLASLPTTSGFFQVRNAQGTISVPATRSVVQRNTTDYALNFGIDPTLHLGSNVVSLNSGIQGTLRRDTRSPAQMNQNLFRVFTYASTSSFLNALSADGFFSAEFGSFTETPITERQVSGAINFRVGLPWGKTALITGWKTTDQRFDSSQLGNSRNFYTSTYIGLSRRFSSRFSAEAIAEDLRAWRSQPYSPIHSAISQALRPAASIRYSPTTRWEMQASGSYELTRGFHVYDMIQNSFTVSYVRPLERNFNESTGAVRLKYPIRLAAGVRTQSFPNFTQGSSQKLVPFFSLTIF
ncbi:MAG: tetratricopeptide repeat protein [Acidobacteria bacterium]|nr:tetratricopeptide repeat protein [Acidobacteriota bacterium]